MIFKAKINDKIVGIEYDEFGFKVSDIITPIDLNTSEGKQRYCTIANKVIEGKNPLDCLIKLLTGKTFTAIDLPNEIESYFIFTTKSNKKRFNRRYRNVHHCFITNEFGFINRIDENVPFENVENIECDNGVFRHKEDIQIPLSTGFLSFICSHLIK